MGSFNVTCFASGQTIASKDRCYVLPVVQAKTFNPVQVRMDDQDGAIWGMTSSNVDSHGFWTPIAWPMSAVYDDYGQVDIDLTSINRERLLTFLLEARTHCPVVLAGQNRSHEIALDFNSWLTADAPDLEKVLHGRFGSLDKVPAPSKLLDEQMLTAWAVLFDRMRENRLFYGTRVSDLRSLGVAYLSGRAYDALVAYTESQVLRWSGVSMERHAFAQRVIEESFGLLDAPAEPDEDQSFRRMRVMDRLRSRLRLADTEGARLGLPYVPVARFVDKHLDAGTRPTPEQLLERLGYLILDQYMIAALNSLNIKFSPVAYCGQDYSNSVGQAYAKFVADVCRQVTADRQVDD